MSASLGWIRQFHRPRTDDLPPLVICPHAGTGASAYRAISQVLSAYFAVVIVQYPGRQDRIREQAPADLSELARGALADYLGSQYDPGAALTVFGHSMGAMVAFEFVRAAEARGREVGLLAASAAVAPGRVAQLPPHPSRDEEILDHLATLAGTGAEVLASREIMRLALPVVKADYRAFDAYDCPPDARVRARIHVLGGAQDPFVTPRDLYGWAAHSEQEIAVTVFDGGHFYLNDNARGIAEILAPRSEAVR